MNGGRKPDAIIVHGTLFPRQRRSGGWDVYYLREFFTKGHCLTVQIFKDSQGWGCWATHERRIHKKLSESRRIMADGYNSADRAVMVAVSEHRFEMGERFWKMVFRKAQVNP